MVKINFSTENAAFRDEEGRLETWEINRILTEISYKIKIGYTSGVIMDYNGNKVGEWTID